MAFAAQLGTFRHIPRKSIFLLAREFVFAALGFDQFALMLIQLVPRQHANVLQVLFDYMAELGNDGRHVFATRLPVTTAGIKDGLELIDDEGYVATLTKYR